MYQQYIVFLLLLTIQPVDPVDDGLLRCYSCTWSRDDESRMYQCMSGLDLEVGAEAELDAPNSQYISRAQCAQCGKQELYKGGVLVSLVRSCTLHHRMLDTDLLPVTGCTTQEMREAQTVNCVCEQHLCNSAFSTHPSPTQTVFRRTFAFLMAFSILYLFGSCRN